MTTPDPARRTLVFLLLSLAYGVVLLWGFVLFPHAGWQTHEARDATEIAETIRAHAWIPTAIFAVASLAVLGGLFERERIVFGAGALFVISLAIAGWASVVYSEYFVRLA